jgi:hypothetical protein
MTIDGQKMTVRIRRRHSRGNPNGWTARIGKATFYFNVLDPQEAIDKAVAKYRAAIGAQPVLSIDEANAVAAGHAVVSADPVDASLWLVEGSGWTESHEPMNRAAWERFLVEQDNHDGSGHEIDHELTRIAQRELGIQTLEPRNRDALDFHEVSVWQIKAALAAAFELGRKTR